jgi:nucleoside-diphosphate-sugar epimerase
VRVLVTGAAGYVAHWLMPELERHGHTVVATDQHDLPDGLVCRGLKRDLLRKGVFRTMLSVVRPDVVVHLAAKYGRLQGEKDPAETVRLNAELTTIVARECGEAGVRLCYVSTSEVYGPVGHEHVRGWDDTRPANLYGLSKLWGEQVCELYAPDRLVIARLNMPYGPGDPKAVAQLGRNALHTFLWQAHHRMPITVHRGTRRSFTWVGDVARGLRMTLEHPAGGRYVVARSDDLRSMEDIAGLACDVASAPRSLIRVEDPPGGITPVKLLDDASTRALGWAPTVDLEDGAARTYGWARGFQVDGRAA